MVANVEGASPQVELDKEWLQGRYTEKYGLFAATLSDACTLQQV